MKKFHLFKVVNICMAVFCIGSICMNYVGVDVLSADTAKSSLNGDTFEYTTSDNSFLFKKNGNLVGFLPTDRKFNFNNQIFNLNSNAIGVGIAQLVGTAVNVGATLGGGTLAGGAAMLSVPGSAAVEATVAGAGVAAAEAAAAAAASTATTGAALAAIAAPVAVGLAIGFVGA